MAAEATCDGGSCALVMVCVIGCYQVYDQLVAMDDFLTFKKLMVRHNQKSDPNSTEQGHVYCEDLCLIL
jgi:hypothetical protein